jgi:DNA repair protein RadC
VENFYIERVASKMEYKIEVPESEKNNTHLVKVFDRSISNEDGEKILSAMDSGNYTEAVRVIYDLASQANQSYALKIGSPEDVAPVLQKYITKEQEYFLVITLDAGYKVINTYEVTKGIANKTIVHPREVFGCAIRDNASAIITAHNHPSGAVKSSREDDEVWNTLVEASKIMGIPCLDNVIVGFNREKFKGELFSYNSQHTIEIKVGSRERNNSYSR